MYARCSNTVLVSAIAGPAPLRCTMPRAPDSWARYECCSSTAPGGMTPDDEGRTALDWLQRAAKTVDRVTVRRTLNATIQ